MSKFLNYAVIGGVAVLGMGVVAYSVADGNVTEASDELLAQVTERNEAAREWAAARQAELDERMAALQAEAQAAEAEETAEPDTEAPTEEATAEGETTAEGEASGASSDPGERAAEASTTKEPAAEGEEIAEGEAPEQPNAEGQDMSSTAGETSERAPDSIDTAAAAPDFETAPSDGPFALGREATEDEIAAWNIDIRFDGQGLPEGSGSVADGEVIYQEQCSACHGTFGEAIGRWPVLAGGEGTLTNARPVKTIGSYWPYLSTVYDYVHRAMPFGNAQSLTDDEVYAVTAYLLNLNFLVDDDFVLSSETFSEVAELPNHGEFYMDDREETEFQQFVSAEACMENCKENVEITKRAAVLDVTPESEEEDTAQIEADTESGIGVGDTANADENAVTEAGNTAEAEGEQMAQADTGAAEAETQPASAAPPDPELVAAGKKVFRQCKSCHMVGEGAKNRSGPLLNGVVGRTIGGVEGFKYSKVFQEAHDAGEMWEDGNLSAFLADPRGTMKGTKMSFRGLNSDDDIAAVIAYLEAEGG